MIFRRALVRELSVTVLSVFLVLCTIMLTTLAIRLLGKAASGSIATDAIFAFLAFSMLGYLPVLMSVTVFIAILLTLTRAYRDSEMVVWQGAGLDLTAWIRPILYLVVPVVIAIAAFSLYIAPWAVTKSEDYRRVLDARDELTAIAPGVFKESKHAERVFFVESFAGDKGTVSNIFMRSEQQQRLGVVFAQHGYETTAANGDRFLVLLNGRRYEGQAGSLDYRILEFGRYAVRIEPYEAKNPPPQVQALSTAKLLELKRPDTTAEFQWRIGLPLGALLLALFAIPLSYVNPRVGRSANLIIAIVVYMVYSNLLSVAQVWVAQQKLAPWPGLWIVHGAMLAVIVAVFYRRIANRVWRLPRT